jgi:acetoin utilization deacetylase AcuC-like enzyme
VDIIYTASSVSYKGNEIERPQRLWGVSSIADKVETDADRGKKYALTVHPPGFIRKFRRNTRQQRDLKKVEVQTYEETFDQACCAVDLAVQAAECEAFACTRPPGHHAGRDYQMGFCFFNNVAIATEHLRRQGKRVCIIDFDGHYGNGTEDIFYDAEDVLFWSIHQDKAYPFASLKNLDREVPYAGKKGATVNVAVPAGADDMVLISSFKGFMPLIERFDPDYSAYLAIDAGFDGHKDDPIKGLDLRYTSEGFHEMGRLIGSLHRKTFAVLEGGYNQATLKDLITTFTEGVEAGKKS